MRFLAAVVVLFAASIATPQDAKPVKFSLDNKKTWVPDAEGLIVNPPDAEAFGYRLIIFDILGPASLDVRSVKGKDPKKAKNDYLNWKLRLYVTSTDGLRVGDQLPDRDFTVRVLKVRQMGTDCAPKTKTPKGKLPAKQPLIEAFLIRDTPKKR